MVIKLLSRHNPSYRSLINYIIKGSERTGEKAQIITHNLRSDNSEGYAKEFLENEATRKYARSNQVFMYHEIVSVSSKENKDVITDKMLNDLAREYIALRGKQGIFFGAVHRDKNHAHIHFCTSGTEYRSGKAFRLSRAQLQELKIRFQDYHNEKYPELTQSTVNHGQGKSYATDKEWQAQHRDERSLVKKEVLHIVKACYAKARTQKEFLELLRDNNLHFYERKGIPTGIVHNNIKIRFTRMEITKKQFENLKPDRTEEEQALADIRSIRERNSEKKLTKSMTPKPGEREKEPTGIRGFMDALEQPAREMQMANREAGSEKDDPEMEME